MNTQIQVKTKVESKTTLTRRIYRAVMADQSIPDDQKRKVLKERFVSEAKVTKSAVHQYIDICAKMAAGVDPHIGRKNANKARSARLKQANEAVVVEEVVESTVDLSQRWVVGTSKTELTGSFKSRAEAQKFAKDNSVKWFDSNLI